MRLSAQDRLRVLENVIGRVGMTGDVLGEYSRALSMANGIDTYNELNTPSVSSNLPSTGASQPVTGTISPEPTQSTTQNNMPLE